MARAAMSNLLVVHAVLLAGKRESSERGRLELRDRAREMVKRATADPKRHVAKAKEGVEDVFGDAHVFAGTKEKEVAKDEYRRGCKRCGCLRLEPNARSGP